MKGRLLLAFSLSLLALGCSTHSSALIAVDTPLVPYVAPDIDEVMGGDLQTEEEDWGSSEDAEPAAEPAPAAPAPAPAAPTAPAAPAAPSKTPSKTPAKGK
jgi:hypothetical protein